MNGRAVVSRHRLQPKYRIALAALWVTPPALLLLTIVWGRGLHPALLDPRLWLPSLVMVLPAAYIWQEGVDVLADGIIARVFWPRYYAYEQLDSWYYDRREGRRVLTIWTASRRKALEVRTAHLTGMPLLLDTLKSHVRSQPWFY